MNLGVANQANQANQPKTHADLKYRYRLIALFLVVGALNSVTAHSETTPNGVPTALPPKVSGDAADLSMPDSPEKKPKKARRKKGNVLNAQAGVEANAPSVDEQNNASSGLTKSTFVVSPQKEQTSGDLKSSGNAPLQFKDGSSDSIPSDRTGLQFNTEAGDTSNQGDSKDPAYGFKSEELGDRALYRLFPGYPRHAATVMVRPLSLDSTWSYSGQDYNYPTTSVGAYLSYAYMPSPIWKIEVDYSASQISIDAVKISTAYSAVSSNVIMDSAFFKVTYCFIGSDSYFSQFCPGVDIGYDSYPLLDFVSNSTLSLSRVKDVTFGLNLSYQLPLTESTYLRMKAGYSLGTGAGNSGALTSKSNRAIALNALAGWDLSSNHAILLGGEYKLREAQISGKRGSNKDTWETNSTVMAAQIGYQHTF